MQKTTNDAVCTYNDSELFPDIATISIRDPDQDPYPTKGVGIHVNPLVKTTMAPKSNATLKGKHARILALLKEATPEHIKTALLSSIPNASAPQVDALSDLVASLASAASTKLHCVRCHESFYEHTNHAKACRIEHDGRADGERTEVGDDAITMMEMCCRIEYDSEHGPPSKWCIVTAHTTRPEEVEYFDEEDSDYGNELVVTCAQNGCLKKRKKAASAEEQRERGGKRRR